ncbi:MAG: GNAT family N-acetyltransferase [Candidatus Bathyarchaeia archaeon]|jgi:RimJ/RimL family protein N-acetyltransferase
MQLGKVFRKFSARDGREVILRTPKWEDLDDLMELINSLVDEKAEIARTDKVTREDEVEWLPKVLASLEKDELFFLVAEVDRKVVASSDIHILNGNEKHVGVLGIVLKSGFRDLGIGTEMMKTLVEQAMALGLKVLTLQAFATNKRAVHVYEKVGFVQTGRVPKKHFKDGQYVDEVIMTKLIE